MIAIFVPSSGIWALISNPFHILQQYLLTTTIIRQLAAFANEQRRCFTVI